MSTTGKSQAQIFATAYAANIAKNMLQSIERVTRMAAGELPQHVVRDVGQRHPRRDSDHRGLSHPDRRGHLHRHLH